MKNWFIFISGIILTSGIIAQEEECFYETTWESDNDLLRQIVLFKNMLWMKIGMENVKIGDYYIVIEIKYSDGKILTKDDELLYYYENNEGILNLLDPNGGMIFKQIPTSDDILIKTIFQGSWVIEDEYGSKLRYIFYGNYCMIQRGEMSIEVTRFSYTEKR